LGALLGVGGAWLAFTKGDISKMTDGMFISFEVTPRIMGLATAVAAALGIIASIAPSIAVARMSVVEGLKTLD
jgi:ABC-type antimicrobial peptide transport system permease subunit